MSPATNVLRALGFASFFAFMSTATAQSCTNFGTSSSSGCLCPPGLGGANCSQPACGGTIFDGSHRSLAPSSAASGGFPNLTSSGCSCANGWTGLGCDVCTTASACQSGYAAVNGNATSDANAQASGLNNTMVCNTSPRVWAAGEISCQVNNPTLQAIYPLQSTLNIHRTLNASLSPLHNVSGIALSPDGSPAVYAQFFYSGVEQFSCSASSCTQTSTSTTDTWTCSTLHCQCVANTSFCGAVQASNLTGTINSLSGPLTIACDNTNTCHFQQQIINGLFGPSGLALQGCVYGECVTQAVIDSANGTSTSGSTTGSSPLSSGVIAGLAVVGSLVGIGLVGVVWGWILQRAAQKRPFDGEQNGGVDVRWTNVSYFVRSSGRDKTILDAVSGHVAAGELLAILGPSGAGKTTLVELIAGKSKSGLFTGSITFPSLVNGRRPRVAFVPQTDILPAVLTVREALTFAASLRLPESLSRDRKAALVSAVISKLGLEDVAETRIGATDGTGRGISGGEARRVSIGLELVGCPDILVCDEPTSGLDSVSARRVVNVLLEVARGGGRLFGSVEDNARGVAVICSVHQPSSRLYHSFDSVVLLSRGRALYSGQGGLAPARHFTSVRNADIERTGDSEVAPYEEGYNVADYLLEVASATPAGSISTPTGTKCNPDELAAVATRSSDEKANGTDVEAVVTRNRSVMGEYATTFLTQFQVLCGREWKLLRRDKSLFFTHLVVSAVLGAFCGGLYFRTGFSIAGFQSRVGCLFFLGSLIAFSSLSALYNIVEIRPLFVRERSNSYYSPTAWLLSRFFFDVIPLRILPTIIVSTMTYWMAGLAHDAAHFFKFLFILVLYTLVMTLFNFLLATLFRNGGIAILVSALTALYQMTYAGFFVHLNSIPPVLRWLQWLCPLKYTLEALSVNEVGSGLMIVDNVQGVPLQISAQLIMKILFGFNPGSYYRDVLVLFAFIAGLAVMLIGVVWFKVKEKR